MAFGFDAATLAALSDCAAAATLSPPPLPGTCFFFFVPLNDDGAEEEEDPSVDDAAESGSENEVKYIPEHNMWICRLQSSKTKIRLREPLLGKLELDTKHFLVVHKILTCDL